MSDYTTEENEIVKALEHALRVYHKGGEFLPGEQAAFEQAVENALNFMKLRPLHRQALLDNPPPQPEVEDEPAPEVKPEPSVKPLIEPAERKRTNAGETDSE